MQAPNAKKTELYTVGEAMLRFSPWGVTAASSNATAETHSDIVPSRAIRFHQRPLRDEEEQQFTRSIAGDELNVAVALSRLSRRALWISVVPQGPLGDIVVNGGAATGVDMRNVKRVGDGAELGIMTVLPEMATVHYQRKNSAFAKHNPDDFDWNKVFENADENSWFHVTGITPLVSQACAETWRRAVDVALSRSMRVSLDFNHRKQLGTLEQLWAIVSPVIHRFYFAIFSTVSIRDIALMSGLRCPSSATQLDDPVWVSTMQALREHWNMQRIACCFKTRDDTGLQRRWSVMIDSDGVHTTIGIPVLHRPNDELGGGSAWAAGLIDGITLSLADPVTMLHRADIVAAMCQETIGDWSETTREQLKVVEDAAPGCAVSIPLHSRASRTTQLMKQAGVVTIIRALNPAMAVARALELIELGAKCIEITMDSKDWLRCLRDIRDRAPEDVVLGIGTVMDHTVHHLREACDAGARFALSPLNPSGFIAECNRLDLVAVPSAFATNEIWDAHCQGAGIIKMFPAAVLGPKNLEIIKTVGEFADVCIMPSGGVNPSEVESWWNAGAWCVGLGTRLAGKEISYQVGTAEYEKAAQQWRDEGREAARTLFAKCAERAAKLRAVSS